VTAKREGRCTTKLFKLLVQAKHKEAVILPYNIRWDLLSTLCGVMVGGL
jgi:hypothetical protein